MPLDTPQLDALVQAPRTMADVLADLEKKETKWKAYKRREMMGDVKSLKEKLGHLVREWQRAADVVTALFDKPLR